MLEAKMVACPYCGERFEALVDPSEAGTTYIQDCSVCCRPIRFDLAHGADGELYIDASAEDA